MEFKTSYIIICLLFNFLTCKSQESIIKDYAIENKIIVFTENYVFPFKYKEDIVQINLSKNDIYDLDKLLEIKYNQLVNWKVKFNEVARLYIAFKDRQGKKAIVQLINLSSKNRRKKFKSYQIEFQNGFGEFYEKNTCYLIIDIDKKIVSIF